MKECTKCGETKPLKAFGRDAGKRDGLFVWCKACCKERRDGLKAQGRCPGHPDRPAAPGSTRCVECIEYDAERRAERKAQGRCTSHPDRPAAPGATRCEECLEYYAERYAELTVQGLCPYHPDRPAAPGATRCEECLERQRERDIEARAHCRARTDEELAADQATTCPRRCPDCKRTLSREWWGTDVNQASGLRAHCLGCHNARASAYRAKKLAAIPPRAADQDVAAAERGASYWSLRTGTPWHADHVVPLDRDGTHEHANLRLLPARLNESKNNRLDCEMWAQGVDVHAAALPFCTAVWEMRANYYDDERGQELPYDPADVGPIDLEAFTASFR